MKTDGETRKGEKRREGWVFRRDDDRIDESGWIRVPGASITTEPSDGERAAGTININHHNTRADREATRQVGSVGVINAKHARKNCRA